MLFFFQNDDQGYYLCMATRKFFFFLDPVRQKKIMITDIIASKLLDEMESVEEASLLELEKDSIGECENTENSAPKQNADQWL